ncbi:siderophore-interacting protein [Streptomonospora sp. S1-112]|uniref:Siderophore-interacting protein n=1 Tax=Streptomonospora mangrovi TaxID=2883123 RepID=A0A9X3NMY0_9ACTN|nr:siderophore-interacting protein [Streptomonospora mangrovi]
MAALWVPNTAKGEGRVSQRGYTLVDVRPDDGTFALDFVLHTTPGPAGDWARAAAVGDELEVALTPARIGLPQGTSHVLLAGDATALPAINSWLAAIPAEVPVRVLIEDGHPDTGALPQAQRPASAASADWRWVAPTADRGAALARAVHAAAPKGDGPAEGRANGAAGGLYVWAAGERALIKRLRTVLRESLRLERSRFHTQYYWIDGRSAG